MASRALRTLNLRAAAARPSSAAVPATTTRRFTGAAARGYAYKDSQDRESLKPGGTEGTKTGRDSEVAHEKGAFDPSTTRPGSEKGEADGHVLDVSGANQAASKPQGDKADGDGGAGRETRKGGKSSGSSTAKAGSV
ncbi:uncharacterized protein ColSpa_06733 [Colletotrichum spaethianum]|uniref:Uncharacterized protein n=1 Tax=Colletotrichum spaethianum TaxID=700344 RepID=A0AA37NYT3_9PEZI|nr:uncharacterized protein ColSpa_06733 [Colletotrichum spaethianum]GKT46552.1 hypothetical protein ColSpa_06733 [Colletotrichum spaethianum]